MKNIMHKRLGLALLAQAAVVGPCLAQQAWQPDRTVLPIRLPARQTYTELDARKATPAAPVPEIQAPPGAPNIVIILLDDMGFGVPETFGGPIPMPSLDKLAGNGLMYTRFHNCALSAPTRTALLSGYNHHSNNMGSITETSTSFPGNNAIRPQTITPMAEVLRQNGYSTAQFGKCHEVPTWQISEAGPQDQWPIRSGFEKFYGFFGGETNQWTPEIYDGVTKIEIPEDPDYHFTTDMTDKAIEWVRYQHSVKPEKPFFIYYAPGATHAPHHVPREWIERNKGKFDEGWDVMRQTTLQRMIEMGVAPPNTQLPPKPSYIKDWDQLTPDEKRLFARQMEVYAGFAEHADYEAGRLIAAIEGLGVIDNTLIIYIAGDNGNSAEGQSNGMFNEMTYVNSVIETVPQMLEHMEEWGSPSTYPHMAAGWAVALDAPFLWTKQVASDFGGSRTGMVICWPARIKAKKELRTQFGHVIDIAPTIYEVTNIPAPRVVNGIQQDPIEGVSLAYTFDYPEAPEKHALQYFECFGNRAVYEDGWYARTIHKVPWSDIPLAKLEEDHWELYNTLEDFSLSKDLAAAYPDKLLAMEGTFMTEAAKYHVLPIDDRLLERLNPKLVGRPTVMEGRNRMDLSEGMKGLGPDIFINLMNTSYTIKAHVEIQGDGNGVIVCQGGRFGGISFYLKEGKPSFTYNYLGLSSTTITTEDPLGPGIYELTYDFTYDGGGRGKGGTGCLSINGEKVTEKRLDKTEPNVFSGTGNDLADVGTDNGTRVADYGPSAKFNGKIINLTIEVK
jgi:arylsulfatase